ncbi:MAG: hypothetical protein ACRDWD_14170 [Acidimicrobiia bacterium]
MIDGLRATGESDVLFFTVADESYVPGLVGLVNSLRLTGHRQRIAVLDVGLAQRTRELLQGECELIQYSADRPLHPYLLYPFAGNLSHNGVMVIVDSDVIVTDTLDPLLAEARNGKICAMAEVKRNRWFPEWEQLLELEAAVRPQPCVNTGFIAFSTQRHPGLLHRWGELIEKVAARDPSWSRGTVDRESPFSNYDQDVLNAVLMSEYEADELVVLPDRRAPGGRDLRDAVRVLDAETLMCTCRGARTLILHDLGQPKAWQGGGLRGVHRDAYLRLLRRVLTGSDVAIQLPPEMLPSWLRGGFSGTMRFRALSLVGNMRNAVQVLRRRTRRVVDRSTGVQPGGLSCSASVAFALLTAFDGAL